MSASNVLESGAIDNVTALVRERIQEPGRALMERFARLYLEGVSDEDLVGFAASDLYGATVAHWRFLTQREAGETKVRVYNPQHDSHGWHSTHTIVEVVCDDMPFLVDSVRMALDRRQLTVHLLIHPVLHFVRDASGQVTDLVSGNGRDRSDGGITEAVMHFEVDRQSGDAALDDIEQNVRAVLSDVFHAVQDWRAMRAALKDSIAGLDSQSLPFDEQTIAETREFLTWVDNNHFTFLGYQELDLSGDEDDLKLTARSGTGLGILRGEEGESRGFSALPIEIRRLALKPELLILTKANRISTVHRPSHLDYIGIKCFDDQGVVVSERRFLGLYTSAAYNRVPADIPLLRSRVERLLTRAGYPPNSHAEKALVNILDNFPRDELFQLDEDALYETVIGILHLQERRRIRLFIHREPFARFFSCIVYVPRERFNTDNRLAIQSILEQALGAHESEFDVYLSESVLARLYFLMRVDPSSDVQYDLKTLEQRLRDSTRNWSDDLHDAVLEYFSEERGASIMSRYAHAFRSYYQERYSPHVAVLDIERAEALSSDGKTLSINLYKALEASEQSLHLKLLHLGSPIALSDALPMLENMGLKVEDETPGEIKPGEGASIWMHDFGLTVRKPLKEELDRVRPVFEEAFDRVFARDMENDGFNALVLGAGLGWRDIVVLRAYCKYLRQLGFTFSQSYIETTLSNNPTIALALARLFNVRFDPNFDGDRDEAQAALVADVRNMLDEVVNLDEDRILRAYLGLIRATLRSNHFQLGSNNEHKPYLSFKLDPAHIAEMPKPKPMYEIFVYSPRVEGVHLRGGPVARGGLRWSDRPEDFRTEVLGLVKAQMVKNAVIVPVGSKGGFFPKLLPTGDREAIQAEGIACYQTFIRGLLDVTDNLVGGEVVPPSQVVRHDGDDPYLVVAADKGTATFSDIANEIAIEYGFWLGDAFASGGSAGYDHKGMGITAKGAWESVKRHFRELGLNTQQQDFTVVGIGDMSGDVFGNGMLLSRHIKLIGAFNHLHIFIDPDPEPGAAFDERDRLFKLPRSTWDDYDKSLISTGGGIYPRSLKSIPINAETRRLFAIDESVESLTPTELISAMLKAPVDLLWNGGIGTYVKASTERNVEVGDRANDGLRVDGCDLRCRVIGEGGNLGVTQLGRIEFNAAGGRVYTDAIDNSAGVDCSDHEVNIKILLNAVVEAGDMTGKQRNTLLAEMTDNVSDLVLRDNYLQTQALSMANEQSVSMFDVHARLMREMERSGALERAIEFLPGEDELVERRAARRGLTTPELSVVLAYVKIGLYQEFLTSDISTDTFLHDALVRYFPNALAERFHGHIIDHRLSREIISTVIANEIVNRAGMTYCFRLREETGASTSDIARAYLAAREIFAMPRLWEQVEALDNVANARGQLTALLQARRLCERAARWLLRNRPRPMDIAETIAIFSEGVARVSDALPQMLSEEQIAHANHMRDALVADGIGQELASEVSWYPELDVALDVVAVASAREIPVEEAAPVYFELGHVLGLDWLKSRVVDLPRDNRWQALARAALRDDVYARQRGLTANALGVDDGDAAERVARWIEHNNSAVVRCQDILTDLRSGAGAPDFAMLSVAMGEIRALEG